MCVAVPGKVVKIEGDLGKVDFNGNLLDIRMGLVKAKPGDYVLVHAGCALEVLKKDQAEEMIALFKELESLLDD